MEDNIPGENSKKIYQYLADVSFYIRIGKYLMIVFKF